MCVLLQGSQCLHSMYASTVNVDNKKTTFNDIEVTFQIRLPCYSHVVLSPAFTGFAQTYMIICTGHPFAINCKLGNDQRNDFVIKTCTIIYICLTRVCYMLNTDLRRFDTGEKRRKEKLH